MRWGIHSPRRDAQVLRDFARMCDAMAVYPKPSRPTSHQTFRLAGGLAIEIAEKLEQLGVTMASQADHIEAEVAAEVEQEKPQ